MIEAYKTERLIAAYIKACGAVRRGVNSRQKFEEIAELLQARNIQFWMRSEQELVELFCAGLDLVRPDYKKRYKDLTGREAIKIFQN